MAKTKIIRVKRIRNAGTMTESQFFGMIKQALRGKSRFWKPIQNAKQEAKRKYIGTNKRQKFEYQCAICKDWFQEKQVEVDHIIDVGPLTCFDDIVPCITRLFAEEGYRVLCKPCHLQRHKDDKEKKKKKDLEILE